MFSEDRWFSFFFYDCELLSSFVFLLLLFVKREKKEQFECLAKIDDFSEKGNVEKRFSHFLFSDLESFIVFVKFR